MSIQSFNDHYQPLVDRVSISRLVGRFLKTRPARLARSAGVTLVDRLVNIRPHSDVETVVFALCVPLLLGVAWWINAH